MRRAACLGVGARGSSWWGSAPRLPTLRRRAGRPVCPVLITYRFRHFNPHWGIVYSPLHVYRLLAQVRATPACHAQHGRRPTSQRASQPTRHSACARVPPPAPRQLVNRVEVEVLPPEHPAEEERLHPHLFSGRVRRLMAQRLGVPLVDQARGGAEAGRGGASAAVSLLAGPLAAGLRMPQPQRFPPLAVLLAALRRRAWRMSATCWGLGCAPTCAARR